MARFLLEEGIRCERCEGELELISRREALPGGKQSRFSRSLLRGGVPHSGPEIHDCATRRG